MGLHTVHCSSMAVVNWDTSPVFQLAGDCVDIWRIAINREDFLLRKMEALLSPAEITRAGRYHHEKDRQRFINSRAALRVILGYYLKVNPALLEFALGPNKKPYLKQPAAKLLFNTSHADNYVLIAVAGTEVGVDVERLNSGFEWRDILAAAFSPAETSNVGAQADPEKAFYTLWTRKEALAKATGKGLQDDFSVYPSLDGEHTIAGDLYGGAWKLVTFPVDDDTLASIAHPAGISRKRFMNFPMNETC
jgi:4'-phosphopantetheinyl transferase